MSLKALSLGIVTAAANGIVVSGATNATPIVVTLNANHGLKNSDRIAVSAVLGNTGANGEWPLASVGATTATLVGSAGNGAYTSGGTVAVICDTTPHMKGHSCSALIGGGLTGTALIEGSDDNVTFADIKAIALPANPVPGTTFEVQLKKYMRLRCSAFTSGVANAVLLG
jgi:hypothetical protein